MQGSRKIGAGEIRLTDATTSMEIHRKDRDTEEQER